LALAAIGFGAERPRFRGLQPRLGLPLPDTCDSAPSSPLRCCIELAAVISAVDRFDRVTGAGPAIASATEHARGDSDESA
jgi:hypothetical protein